MKFFRAVRGKVKVPCWVFGALMVFSSRVTYRPKWHILGQLIRNPYDSFSGSGGPCRSLFWSSKGATGSLPAGPLVALTWKLTCRQPNREPEQKRRKMLVRTCLQGNTCINSCETFLGGMVRQSTSGPPATAPSPTPGCGGRRVKFF